MGVLEGVSGSHNGRIRCSHSRHCVVIGWVRRGVRVGVLEGVLGWVSGSRNGRTEVCLTGMRGCWKVCWMG